jgi:D-arabinose 1-dehydrogenase-like Zn-dependent alcohol dehydrogenase
LVAAGHHVIGTTRTERKADLIRHLGAEAIVADGLDAMSLQRAADRARPDAIVDLLPDFPPVIS